MADNTIKTGISVETGETTQKLREVAGAFSATASEIKSEFESLAKSLDGAIKGAAKSIEDAATAMARKFKDAGIGAEASKATKEVSNAAEQAKKEVTAAQVGQALKETLAPATKAAREAADKLRESKLGKTISEGLELGKAAVREFAATVDSTMRAARNFTQEAATSMERAFKNLDIGGHVIKAFKDVSGAIANVKQDVQAAHIGQTLKDVFTFAGQAANNAANQLKNSQLGQAISAGLAKGKEVVQSLTKDFDKIKGSGAEATEAIAQGLGVLTGLPLGQVVTFIDGIKDGLLKLGTLSNDTGIAVEKIVELKDAMTAANVPIENLPAHLTALNGSIKSAASGSADAQKAFAAMGVETDGWNKKMPPTDAVLLKLADHIKNSKNPSEELSKATKLLGDKTDELIPFLQQGSAAILQQMNAHIAHGQVVAHSVESAKILQEKEEQLKGAISSLAETIETVLLPVFDALVTLVQLIIAGVIKWKAVFEIVGQVIGLVINSIINNFKTLGTILKDVFTGHWGAIVSDAKKADTDLAADVARTAKEIGRIWQEGEEKAEAVFATQTKEVKAGNQGLTNDAQKHANNRVSIESNANKQVAELRSQLNKNLLELDTKSATDSKEENAEANLAIVGNDQQTLARLSTLFRSFENTQVTLAKGTANNEITIAQNKENTKNKIAQQAAEFRAKLEQAAEQRLQGLFSNAIKGMIDGTKSFSKAFSEMASQLVNDLASSLTTMLSQWIAHHIAKLLVFTQEKQGEVVAEDAASTESKAISKSGSLIEIQNNAATAATGVYRHESPLIGPVLAGLAAAGTYAATLAFGTLTSAAGGIYEVDRDQLAFIHKSESVIPASYAAGLRQLINNGGATGGNQGVTVVVNHSVNAIDAASFQTTIKRHGNLIGNEVARVLKQRGVGSK